MSKTPDIPSFTLLNGIEDPRTSKNQQHSLETILVIAICAVIAGAEDFTGIWRYGKAKQAWLSGFLDMLNGIPSHDTFRRVLSLLKPEAF